MRDYREECRAAWKAARGRGMSVDEALNAMKGLNLGLGIVLQTLCEMEKMEIEAAVELIERRGDYEDFKDK